MTSDIPTKNDEENSESEDCFIKYKFAPLFEEKTSKTEIQQPANLVEHINAITTLIIYHTYSKQHQSAKSYSIRDDIDRFDAVYSCLIDQKSHQLSHDLRDRFFSLGKN